MMSEMLLKRDLLAYLDIKIMFMKNRRQSNAVDCFFSKFSRRVRLGEEMIMKALFNPVVELTNCFFNFNIFLKQFLEFSSHVILLFITFRPHELYL